MDEIFAIMSHISQRDIAITVLGFFVGAAYYAFVSAGAVARAVHSAERWAEIRHDVEFEKFKREMLEKYNARISREEQQLRDVLKGIENARAFKHNIAERMSLRTAA